MEVPINSGTGDRPSFRWSGVAQEEGFLYVSFERHDLGAQHARNRRFALSDNSFTATNIRSTSSAICIFGHSRNWHFSLVVSRRSGMFVLYIVVSHN